MCVNRVFLLWKEYKCKDVERKCLIKLVSRSRYEGDTSRIRSKALPTSMSNLVDWHIDTNVSEEIVVWDRGRGFYRNVNNYVPKYTGSYSTRPLYSRTKQHASSLATPHLTSVLRLWSRVRRDRVCVCVCVCVWAQTVWALRWLAAPRTYWSQHWDGLCAAETVCEVHAVKLLRAVKPRKCHSAVGVSNFTPCNLSKPKTYFMYSTTRFNIQKFCVLPTLHLCVSREPQNQQRLFHYNN
jgi:hypothetical protein